MSERRDEKKDGLLPWIAAERALRTVLLLVVGIVLLTHSHTDWAAEIARLARTMGLDPKENWIRRILKDAARIDAHKDVLFGVVAIAYAVLEGAEAYGLWHRRRWGEWLTVFATSLLLIPEIWEITKSATVLKVGGLIVNLLIVLYLLARLDALPGVRGGRRRGRRPDPGGAVEPGGG